MSSSSTQDWDVIYRFINKFGRWAKGSGIKRSQQESSAATPISAVGSLLYGLSMAAGLAMGVSIAESPLLNSVINGMDYRFATRRSQPDQNQATSASMPSVKSIEPIVHRFVAASKDGKDHFHHVVHYHIPYPLSLGALETARQNYPQISWYGTGAAGSEAGKNPNSDKSPSILSAYLGPTYKHADHHNPHRLGTNDENFSDGIRRNDRRDFHVFSEAEYFKKLQRPRHKYPQSSESPDPPVKSSSTFEDMLFTDTKMPNLLGEPHPNHKNEEPDEQQSSSTNSTLKA